MMRRALLPALLLLLSACTPRPEALYETQVLAFGTLIDLTIYGAPRELAEAAATRMSGELTLMNDAWHAWRPSTLGEFNTRCASGEPFAADPGLLPLIRLSHDLAEASGELFNPAASRLFALWGFHSDDPHGPPPAAEAVAELVAQHPSMADVHIEGGTVQCTNPAVKLDLGGIAKGYGVDRIIDMLREMGIENAIINGGGGLRAIGRHGERPWRIGIRDPRGPGSIAAVEVSGDESVFTSGDYERYYEHEGRRYHHIIDPRSGYPAAGTRSVTVIADNGTLADAAATALVVAGPEAWRSVARDMGIRYVMLIDSEGTVHMNPAMAERVSFVNDPPPRVVISAPL